MTTTEQELCLFIGGPLDLRTIWVNVGVSWHCVPDHQPLKSDVDALNKPAPFNQTCYTRRAIYFAGFDDWALTREEKTGDYIFALETMTDEEVRRNCQRRFPAGLPYLNLGKDSGKGEKAQ